MNPATRERPEHTVLRQCARAHADAVSVRTAIAAASALDWPYLRSTADAHFVTELLLPALQSARTVVPPGIVDALERRGVEVTALNLSRASQLADLIERLRANGIRALAFRGPTLAAAMYGHVGLRYSADLDVLVGRREAHRVRALMLKDGYALPPRERHRAGSLLHGLYRGAGRDDVLCPARLDLAKVEIHVAFAFWTQGIRLDTRPMFDRSVIVDLGGVSIPTLCADDLLLVLAIHGMMHGWSALRLLSDVDAVAPRVADWDAVMRRAREARMGRVLRVALLLAREGLGTELPAPAIAFAEEDATAAALARGAALRLFDPPPAARWDPLPWHVAFLERSSDRLRFHARRLVYEWFLKWPWDEWLGRRRGSSTLHGA